MALGKKQLGSQGGKIAAQSLTTFKFWNLEFLLYKKWDLGQS
jgi:hypothetical protein